MSGPPILEYTMISSSFQALKCVIRAKDPHLHLINVAVPGFLNPHLRPQGVLKVEPILQYKAMDEATPSQPAIKEEEEEKVVEILDSKDNFEVFNRLKSLEASIDDFSHLPSAQVSQIQEDFFITEAMGIQRKPKAGLLGVMESQSGSKALERLLQRSSPHPLHPFCLPDLILWTTREKGIKEALKQWREGKVPSLRRQSSKGEPNSPR